MGDVVNFRFHHRDSYLRRQLYSDVPAVQGGHKSDRQKKAPRGPRGSWAGAIRQESGPGLQRPEVNEPNHDANVPPDRTEKKKAGTSRFRPLSRRLIDRCQYIRGQRSETNSIWLDAEVGAAKSRVAWGRGSSSPNRPS
jgi:hypothetical protein